MEIKELTFEELEALILTLVKEYGKGDIDYQGRIDVYSGLTQIHMTAIERKLESINNNHGEEAAKWEGLQNKAHKTLVSLHEVTD